MTRQEAEFATGEPQGSDGSGVDPGYSSSDIKRPSTLQLSMPDFDLIVRSAIESAASDIHVEPFATTLRLRFRVDGKLRVFAEHDVSYAASLVARIKVLARIDIAEKRRPQDGQIVYRHDGDSVDLRVSVFPTRHGEKVVIRILDNRNTRRTIGDLGIPNTGLSIFRNKLQSHRGMILVTGPTGSGKTTTLYAALSELNSTGVNISTLEDPVEYEIAGICQSSIRTDLGFTFSSALRSVLRQDPDIIMVGEIRDPETAQIAIRAALTGHLVLSTLHTTDSVGAVARLADMQVDSYLISAALSLVVAQRLVRRLCTECLHPRAGCSSCNQSGYKGRVAIFEILPIDDVVRAHINGQVTEEELRKHQKTARRMSLASHGRDLVRRGITSESEIARVQE
ncbi:MAG: type II/IV secretion system protein [Rhodothermales bacterium]|nr:type II/IV secretion system protein [Rhodothermales bacterium]